MSVFAKPLSPEEALLFAELSEKVALAWDIDALAETALPVIGKVKRSPALFLYITCASMFTSRFYPHGFEPEKAVRLEGLCAEQYQTIAGRAGLEQVPRYSSKIPDMEMYPLWDANECIALLGLSPGEEPPTVSAELWKRALYLLSSSISRMTETDKNERKLAHLNTYLTVSSTLAQMVGLHDVMEIALYGCMEAVGAETASVLLLDDAQEKFHFYHVEGPTKPVLMKETFPADKGLAGAVLETQQAEIINNVLGDERFYKKVDSKSGFQTRNMIVLPLTAGKERIGVLEALNKVGGEDFQDDEMLLLLLIAEEIAFAIRNAKVFEVVVNSYCKQRQGLNSCKGCERPLRTWTPCIKYQEVEEIRL